MADPHPDVANRRLARTISLAGIVGSEPDGGIVEEWRAQGLNGTLFVAPEVLVQSPKRFAGDNELGNGCLVDATVDGSLDRWTMDSLLCEIKSAEELHQELGFGQPQSFFLPGHDHRVADGSYRRPLQIHYPVVASPAESACTVLGQRRLIHPIVIGANQLDDFSPLLTDEPDPSPRTILLIISGEPALAKLRQALYQLLSAKRDSWQIAPLRALIPASQAYSI